MDIADTREALAYAMRIWLKETRCSSARGQPCVLE
jgi:hypothetical protein